MVDDKQIEECIKKMVWEVPVPDVTVSLIRQKVESELELKDGFLKQPSWKGHSKNLIISLFEERQAREGASGGSEDSGDDKKDGSDDENDNGNDEIQIKDDEESGYKPGDGNESDSSVMSEVIDVPPPPKRAKPKQEAVKKEPKKEPKKRQSSGSSSKKDDEISKLKSQLLKCGLRKNWKKILDPMQNDLARVQYLREQLSQLGMTGRFSEAKAKKIKEEREYAQEMADLNAEAANMLETSSRGGRRLRNAADNAPASASDSSSGSGSDDNGNNGGNSDSDVNEDSDGSGDKRPHKKARIVIEDSDEED